jgi:hypothetical protein
LQVCVGWKSGDKDPALLGSCANATAAYVPSLSTRIACEGCDGTLGPFSWAEANASDAWAAAHGWPADPMWVESNWPQGVPFVQIYLLKPYGARVSGRAWAAKGRMMGPSSWAGRLEAAGARRRQQRAAGGDGTAAPPHGGRARGAACLRSWAL